MQCAKCSGELIELRAGTVAVDRCDTCAGLWFDPRELAAVIAQVRAKGFADSQDGTSQDGGEPTAPPAGESGADAGLDEQAGVCPRCRIALDRTETLTFDGLHYDRCGQCGGAWLDAGELKKIASDADASAEMEFFTKRRG